MLQIAEDFARTGAVVVAIDAPWSRRGELPDFTERDRADQIQLMVDLRRAVDLLRDRDDVDDRRIAYFGVSYGGAMGGLLAGIEDRIAAFVLDVGDGGLVSHFTGADDADGPLSQLPPARRTRWLDAMRPIEPLSGSATPTRPSCSSQPGTTSSFRLPMLGSTSGRPTSRRMCGGTTRATSSRPKRRATRHGGSRRRSALSATSTRPAGSQGRGRRTRTRRQVETAIPLKPKENRNVPNASAPRRKPSGDESHLPNSLDETRPSRAKEEQAGGRDGQGRSRTSPRSANGVVPRVCRDLMRSIEPL